MNAFEDWKPFVVCPKDRHPPKPRDLSHKDGLGDRLRSAAFAEFQAIKAFDWASRRFMDVPASLRDEWANLVPVEQRHYEWIAHRMQELGVDPAARPVSLRLWYSLAECETGKDFCIRIASAEERGRLAGLHLIEVMKDRDKRTVEIFQKIVDEELDHVAVANRYFNWKPSVGY